jgi:hypothetical protein
MESFVCTLSHVVLKIISYWYLKIKSNTTTIFRFIDRIFIGIYILILLVGSRT